MSDSAATQLQENKMGTMPVGRLIFSMSIPMMISMLVQALYNIVDSIFVAQISEDALTAVSLAFPIQNLMIAVAVGTAVGVNALLSRRLGEKNQEDVDKCAGNSLFLSAASAVVFIILGFTIPRFFFETQTDNPAIIEYGVTYLEICMIWCFGVFCSITLERLLASTGRTGLSMVSQLVGTAFNLMFDPLLIFGYWGFPKMGIAGAAIATVMGQFAAMITSLILNLKYNKDINFKLKELLPDGRIIKGIYSVGVPSILLQSVGSVMVYFLNMILGAFSSTAIAVFGVYFKLQSFIFMPIFGLNNGVVPIIAYNFGARKKSRIKRAVFVGTISAFCIMSVGTLIFELLPGWLLGFFNASEQMLFMGIPALRIIAVHFPIAAICIIFGSVLQAFGEGVKSMIVSFIRQLVVLLPVAWLLSLTGNVNAVWWAFPIAETASLTCTLIFYSGLNKKYLKPMAD